MFFKQKFLKIIIILFFTISIDQLSKSIAYKELFLKDNIFYINEFLSLTPVWNKGISFGMFQDFGDYGRFTFTIIAFIISVWLIWSSINLQRLSSIGYILIAGGALGNATDRIIYGKVIDFIDFHYLDMHWPVFNFADTFIFIGVSLFLYNEFFLSKAKKKNDYKIIFKF